MAGIAPIRRSQLHKGTQRAEVSLLVLADFPNVAEAPPQRSALDEPPAFEVETEPGSDDTPERSRNGRSRRHIKYRIDNPEGGQQRPQPEETVKAGFKPRHLLISALLVVVLVLGFMIFNRPDPELRQAPSAWPSSAVEQGSQEAELTPISEGATNSIAITEPQNDKANQTTGNVTSPSKTNTMEPLSNESKNTTAESQDAQPAKPTDVPGVARLNGTIGKPDLRAENQAKPAGRY